MTTVDIRLIVILLAIVTLPAVLAIGGAAPMAPVAPVAPATPLTPPVAPATERCDLEPDTLGIRAEDIISILREARNDFQSVFNLTDGRCPCLDSSDPDCFENQLRLVNSTLAELSGQLTNLTELQTEECPALEGCAALVASEESPDIAVVDPVGTILQDINVNSNISAFTVGERQSDESFNLYFISNDPFVLKRLEYPGFSETTVADEADLSSSGVGTGITFCGDLLYVTIDYAADNVDDVILSVNQTDFTVDQVAAFSCKPGTIRAYHGRLYYVSCNDIVSINKTGGDLQKEVKFPVTIASFDVIDSDRIVFCDGVGGLWIHNAATGCSKLLTCKENACGDVRINSCTSLVYAVYPNDANLDIFNSTTCESAGTLPYTEAVPTGSPSLDFEPACLP